MQRYRYIVSKRGRNVNDCFYLLRGGAPRPHALRVRFFCGVAPAGLLGVALVAGWPPPGLWALPFLRLAARWGFGRCLFLRGGPRRGLGLHSCGSSSAKQGGGYAPPHPAPTLSGKSRQKAAARSPAQSARWALAVPNACFAGGLRVAFAFGEWPTGPPLPSGPAKTPKCRFWARGRTIGALCPEGGFALVS